MDIINFFSEHYDWLLSLYALLGVGVVTLLGKFLLPLVPAFKRTAERNKEAAAKRMTRSYYNPVQKKSKLWGLMTMFSIYIFILPFFLTAEAQPWWKILLDIFIILMVYDFFYYLTHRFLFHDGPLGAPLKFVHAVHHQQKNPCRMDSSYLHPLEPTIGLGLYGGTIALVGIFMGDFHLITIIFTWIAFSEINQHNHDLMDEDHFPFRYLNYLSYMHHVHHARFSAGNFATISLFYDWLFGTYDKGDGYGKQKDSGKKASA